jgi:hypothetical protein
MQVFAEYEDRYNLEREDFELSGRHGPRCSSTPTDITVLYIFVWILVYGGINCLNKYCVPKICGILHFRLYGLDKSSIRCTNNSSISDTDCADRLSPAHPPSYTSE